MGEDSAASRISPDLPLSVPAMTSFMSVKAWALDAKRYGITPPLAACDSRMPWFAQLLTPVIVGYIRSPVDLIPDFIPIKRYLKRLVIVPVGSPPAVTPMLPDLIADDYSTTLHAGAGHK